jgi:hypothetical protein
MKTILALVALLMFTSVLASAAPLTYNYTNSFSNEKFDMLTITNPVQGQWTWVRIYIDVPPLTMTNVVVTALNNQIMVRPTEHRFIISTAYTNTANGDIKQLAVTNLNHSFLWAGNSGSTSSNSLRFSTMGANYFDVAVTNNFATRLNINVCAP